MKKIKIAQIGIGHNHGASKMAACRKFPEIYDVVGFAEKDENWLKKRGDMPQYRDLTRYTEDEILSMTDLDAVLVETDVWDLDSTAKKCIDCGFHIHLDKPAGENIDEYALLLRCAKEKQLVVQLGYMYRNNPAIKKAKELIESGTLGEILYIDTMMSTDHSAEYRKWLEHFKGGSMYIFGCHLIDIIYDIMGSPDNIIPHLTKSKLDGTDSFDNDIALLEYPTGTSTVRTSSVEVNGFGRRQIVICGTKGTIEIKPIERPTKMFLSLRKDITDVYGNSGKLIECEQIGDEKRYDEMMLDFADYIIGKKLNPYTYDYELELHKLILSACGMEV